jgi:hypothetical protein
VRRVPEPRGEEAAGGGGVFLSSTGNTAPRSGSVRAIDGSTITWTTSANGKLNAVGAAGQQMATTPIRESGGEFAVRVTFAVARRGTYLTLDRSINENNRVASVGITGGGLSRAKAPGLKSNPALTLPRQTENGHHSLCRLRRVLRLSGEAMRTPGHSRAAAEWG